MLSATRGPQRALLGPKRGAWRSAGKRPFVENEPHQANLEESLRESSDKAGTTQRRLTWPARKGDAHKPRVVQSSYAARPWSAWVSALARTVAFAPTVLAVGRPAGGTVGNGGCEAVATSLRYTSIALIKDVARFSMCACRLWIWGRADLLWVVPIFGDGNPNLLAIMRVGRYR